MALRGGAIAAALLGADAREVVRRVGSEPERCGLEPRAAGERQQGVQKVAHRVGVRSLLELELEGVRERNARDNIKGLFIFLALYIYISFI